MGEQTSPVVSPDHVRVTNRVLCLCLLSRSKQQAYGHVFKPWVHYVLVLPTNHKREPGQNFIELCTTKYDVPCETPPATWAQVL